MKLTTDIRIHPAYDEAGLSGVVLCLKGEDASQDLEYAFGLSQEDQFEPFLLDQNQIEAIVQELTQVLNEIGSTGHGGLH